MRAFLDTNVLLRHLTGSPPDQARRATAFLRGRHELILTGLVAAELVYVLESVYERPRHEIATAARAVLALPSVFTVDRDVVLRAIELYETSRLHFAETFLAAAAERSGVRRVASFDRSLDRLASVTRVEP